MHQPHATIKDLFASSLARYLNVRPSGLQFPHGPIRSSTLASILACRPARTLYQTGKPLCRSLDGIQSIREGRACASCLLRKTCTPQIYLELLIDAVPYRLLLAYTSARNFMQFASRLREQGQPVEKAEVIISVRDRGRWGELRFVAKPTEQRS
jgi:hypothetical protein